MAKGIFFFWLFFFFFFLNKPTTYLIINGVHLKKFGAHRLTRNLGAKLKENKVQFVSLNRSLQLLSSKQTI